MRSIVALALAFAAAGCAGEHERVVIGYFELAATRVQSCAEQGLLAAPEQAALTVHLQRFGTTLHWDHGDGLLIGTFDAQRGSFSVEQSLWIDMRSEGDGLAPCVIERRLVIEAALHGPEQGGAYQGFDGTMRYEYSPTESSLCDDLLAGEQPLATALPCSVSFEIVAEQADG